jgi:hypothetical protein
VLQLRHLVDDALAPVLNIVLVGALLAKVKLWVVLE